MIVGEARQSGIYHTVADGMRQTFGFVFMLFRPEMFALKDLPGQ